MADFNLFYPVLIGHEGGYAHDKDDKGGETYRGVARAFNPSWSGWLIVDGVKKQLQLVPKNGRIQPMDFPRLNKALAGYTDLQAKVRNFYKAAYWDPLQLDTVGNQSLATMLCDHGVNAGVGRVPRMLQFALKTMGYEIKVDGKMGAFTVATLHDAEPELLLQVFGELRKACYRFRSAVPIAEVISKCLLDPAPEKDALLNLFAELKIVPNASQAKFLVTWLTRVRAITYAP